MADNPMQFTSISGGEECIENPRKGTASMSHYLLFLIVNVNRRAKEASDGCQTLPVLHSYKEDYPDCTDVSERVNPG